MRKIGVRGQIVDSGKAVPLEAVTLCIGNRRGTSDYFPPPATNFLLFFIACAGKMW